jgi:hypothetical protein
VIPVFDAHAPVAWTVWYAVLWLLILPFVLLVAYAFLRVTPAHSNEESTWLNGAVLSAFVLLIGTTFVSAIFVAHARPGRAWWGYLMWLAVHFVCWTFLGSGIFFASLQALAAGPRVWLRRLSSLLALAGVMLLHVASLYATHVFRHRP